MIAHEEGVVRGYLVGRFIEFLHVDAALYIPEWGMATGPNPDRSTDTSPRGADNNRERLIRRMYAWLTRSGQPDQSSLHTITLFASDQSAISAWSSLGFGGHLIDAARTTQASATKASAFVRAATLADLDPLAILQQKLRSHLSQPPVYPPASESKFDPERLPGPRSYATVAVVESKIVGFMSCQLGGRQSLTLRDDSIPHLNAAYVEPHYRGSDVANALLTDVLAWCREHSADRITVGFETANVEGADFWLRSGFEPVLRALVRRVQV